MDVHMHKDNISQNTNDFFPLPPFWPFSLFLYTACVQCKNVEMYTGPEELGQRGVVLFLFKLGCGVESVLLPLIFTTSCYPSVSNLPPILVCILTIYVHA